MKLSFPLNQSYLLIVVKKTFVKDFSCPTISVIRWKRRGVESRLIGRLCWRWKPAFFVLFRSALIRGNEAALYWPTNTKNARILSRPLKQNVRGNSNVYVYNMNLIWIYSFFESHCLHLWGIGNVSWIPNRQSSPLLFHANSLPGLFNRQWVKLFSVLKGSNKNQASLINL